MDESKTKAGQGFGVAGLLLGIISLFFAFLPRIGLLAVFFGIIAIVFCIIGLNQANKANGTRILNLTALVICIFATTFATVWILSFQAGSHSQNTGDQTDNFGKDDNTSSINGDMEKTMEKLESSDTTYFNFNLSKDMSRSEFDHFLKDYEGVMRKTADEVNAIKSSDTGSVMAYSREAVILSKILSKVGISAQDLTPEQNKKIEAINNKYKNLLARIQNSKK